VRAQFLEEAAIWSRVVRLAGSGSGALLATLLTLGYSSQQLEQLCSFDMRKLTRGTSPPIPPVIASFNTAPFPFSHLGFTTWISQTVYCYF